MLVDLAPTAVWLGNPDGSLSYLSDGWYDYTGQTADDALPSGWWDAIHPDDVARGDVFSQLGNLEFGGHYRFAVVTSYQFPVAGFQFPVTG